MWNTVRDWQANEKKWRTESFLAISGDDVSNQVTNYSRNLAKVFFIYICKIALIFLVAILLDSQVKSNHRKSSLQRNRCSDQERIGCF